MSDNRCKFDKNMLISILKKRVEDDTTINLVLLPYRDDYRCEREAYHDGLCIFHSHKKPDNFREELDKEIDRMLNDEEIKELDFTGCIFPKIDLSRKKFNKPINFIGASFQSKANFKAQNLKQQPYI
ncbi:MAG: hypothetical protein KatS3mg003_1217 [Candidatus Nitrosocaldaceae archaeon]|nr:MAG: hypothetical protein KatS3mg003_1217 [Candidatus Nitrosocaldaceae archaeon]